MGDDGIGIELIARLRKLKDRLPNTEFMDVGLSVHSVLHALVGREKAILIDCGHMNLEPGTLRRFERDEVISRRCNPHLTFHGMNLLTVLDLSRSLGELPDEVAIFASALTEGDIQDIMKIGLSQLVLSVESVGKLPIAWGEVKMAY